MPIPVITPTQVVEPIIYPNIPLVQRIDLTAAQVAGANSNPILLLPGLTGYAYAVISGTLLKTTATVFTGVQAARVSYGNSNLTTTGVIFDAAIFSTATITSEITPCPGQTRYVAAGDGTSSDIGGVGLKFNVLVSDMGAGCPCTIVLAYMIYPIIVANLGNV